MYGRWLRNSFIYLLILVAIVAIVFTVFRDGGESPVEKTTAASSSQQSKQARSQTVEGRRRHGRLHDSRRSDRELRAKMEEGDTVRPGMLQDAGIPVSELAR